MPRDQTKLLLGATRAIPLNELPESAWRVVSGNSSDNESKFDIISLRNRVGILRRSIDVRADTIASVPWSISDASGKQIYISNDRNQQSLPQLEWLLSPTNTTSPTLSNILRLIEISLLLKSEAFVYIQRSVSKKPLNLRWLSPLFVKPQWSDIGTIMAYERRLKTGVAELLPTDDICYVWIQNPMHETEPDTPLAISTAGAAATLASIGEFANTFFERGAIRATLLTVEGTPEPAVLKRLKAWWDRVFNRGIDSAWGTEVFTGVVKPVPVGDGISELSNSDFTNENRENIATTLGVPHSMLFSNAANFATASTDKRNFYDETIIPRLELIQHFLNRQLFEQFDLSFNFEHETMDLFQQDENERADALTKYVSAGVPLSVAGQLLGIELPNGTEWDSLTSPDSTPSHDTLPSNTSQKPPVASLGVKLSVANDAQAVPSAVTDQLSLRADDLARWQRKAINRISRGETAACEFDSAYISNFDATLIADRLKHATSADEVRSAFDPFFGDGALIEALTFTEWLTSNDAIRLSDHPTRHLAPRTRRFIAAATLFGSDRAHIERPSSDTSEWHGATKAASEDDEREELARVERRAQEEIAAALEEQRNSVYQQNENVTSGSPEDVNISALVAAPSRLPTESATEALRAALLESSSLGVTLASRKLADVELTFNWDLPNEDARQWAEAHTGDTIIGIEATSRTALRSAIADWVESGDPLSALERRLAPIFGGDRAELIASTETTLAYAQGNRIAYRASGVVSKIEWSTAEDELVCPICGPLDGTATALEDGFAQFAHATPPAHPRCRCIILPIIDRDLVAQQAAGTA